MATPIGEDVSGQLRLRRKRNTRDIDSQSTEEFGEPHFEFIHVSDEGSEPHIGTGIFLNVS